MRKAFQHLVLLLLLVSGSTFAGSQIEEPLSNSVKAMMQRSISDKAAPRLVFATPEEGQAWLSEMCIRDRRNIEQAIEASEKTHAGEIRFVVEAGLHPLRCV